MNSALNNLDQDRQQVVRAKVRGLLDKSQAFSQLTPEERLEMANGLVNVVAFLSDPKAGQKDDFTQAMAVSPAPLATGQAKGQKIVQEDFTAAAGREGAEIFEQLANAVDFPEFVAELIDGVFNSIVDASIRQMEAYSKLLESVVKSVDEFAKDNFTPNQGRDWLANRFPNTLQIKVQDNQPRLQLTPQGEESGGLEEIQNTLGLQQTPELDDEESEAALAQRAQLEMARLRQKQLATMVLLGINRIVVTDGLINAKVVIDVRTSDVATRTNRASNYDSKEMQHYHRSGGGWFSSDSDTKKERTRTIVTSSTDETSEAKAEAKAKLSGEVRINFKSETYPLDKLASQTQLESVNQTATPGG